MLDAKRQLLLALSHELRSPLARARIATELLTDDRQRDRLQEDLAEMARLIEDLTESERLRTPHATLLRESLDFAELVMTELTPLGLSPSAPGPTPIIGDATRLRVMVRNLVSNALHHGKDSNGVATVDVSIESDPANRPGTRVTAELPR